MERLEEMVSATKLSDILKKRDEDKVKKTILWIGKSRTGIWNSHDSFGRIRKDSKGKKGAGRYLYTGAGN